MKSHTASSLPTGARSIGAREAFGASLQRAAVAH
jgi:hypothetical protein